ncbi:hypothetical protein KORDIASMS9_01679 [Kordia sp. SMS9]|uniref:hypothetical protein n=1 Tax=Kordia sp. SMS9 TaxID=2282170 RepID=UPI000E100783|nr:hypothetical protein [Kordia sp. SMS9]AXG69457.1 hypothetical protein KORDIASMS9_01679 [Kordia sp. SMS9]
MLEKFKKFEVKNLQLISGGDLPDGWWGQCNSDGTISVYNANGDFVANYPMDLE